jgi:hypothetical protein
VTEVSLNLTEVFLTLTEVFLTLTEVFPCFFLSCKPNARVKLAKTGHGPHSSALVCICVVWLLLSVLLGCYLCCSVYCLCVNVYCHRVTTQLQLINISNDLPSCISATISRTFLTPPTCPNKTRTRRFNTEVRIPVISQTFPSVRSSSG